MAPGHLSKVSGQTIRQQAKAQRVNPKSNTVNQASTTTSNWLSSSASVDKSLASKDVTKATLANPLTIGWPNIPRHVQTSILALIPDLLPKSIAEYHASRDQRHRSSKRRKRYTKNLESTNVEKENIATETSALNPRVVPVQSNASSQSPKPEAPEILNHLILGLNETLKALESATEQIQLRMLLLHEAILSTSRNLLPTAPPLKSTTDDQYETDPALPVFVIVPHLSVSPIALVTPILNYCATLNARIYQHSQLVAMARNRLSVARLKEMGEGEEAVKEVRVVPLGKEEIALATATGLRRVTSVVIKASHPSLQKLEALLPISILKSQRHAITLAFGPLSILNNPASKSTCTSTSDPTSISINAAVPLPTVQYAPVHVKAIRTVAPADPTSRKKARLEDVRRKRVEKKAKMRENKAKIEASWKIGVGKERVKAPRGKKRNRKVKVKPKGNGQRVAALKEGKGIEKHDISKS